MDENIRKDVLNKLGLKRAELAAQIKDIDEKIVAVKGFGVFADGISALTFTRQIPENQWVNPLDRGYAAAMFYADALTRSASAACRKQNICVGKKPDRDGMPRTHYPKEILEQCHARLKNRWNNYFR